MPSGRFANQTELIGRRFNDLVAIKYLYTQRRGRIITYWLCQCDCGKTCEVGRNNLMTGNTKSCGCRKHRPSTKWTGYKEISGSFWRKVERSANSRGLAIRLTIEEAWSLFIKQNRKCIFTGLEITFARHFASKQHQTASLDRIDSTKDYYIGNVQWVHKAIQPMKDDMSDEDFIMFCRLVADHQKYRGIIPWTIPNERKLLPAFSQDLLVVA